jgi:hypothetical protein
MTRAAEFATLQNLALGAIALRVFSEAFLESDEPHPGVEFPLILPVLPIVFHKESVKSLASRQFAGGLFRAIAEDRTLPAGLQHRVEGMVHQTLTAFRAACAADLLRYDPQDAIVQLGRRSIPQELLGGDNRPILMTARRLGRWFGDLPTQQLRILLELGF